MSSTRRGIFMLKTCPRSLDILNNAAQLACMAEDREFAKRCFDLIGDVYFSDGHAWDSPEQMAHCRKWAETGKW